MKTKKILVIKFILIILAVMPGFSIFKAPTVTFSIESNLALPAPTNSFVMQLKQEGVQIFAGDKKIQNIENVFVDTTHEPFKNTFRVDTLYSRKEFLSKFGQNIVYIEPERIVKIDATTVNDPGFSSDTKNVDRQWGLHSAKFPEAWDKSVGSPNVVVAIIDTGIDGTHEDLGAGQVAPGFDFIQKTVIPFSTNSDDNGHGTLVAGVVGATPNNFRGIVGGSWNSLLLPLKALDSTGMGNSADVAAAIVYAADHNANVVNMSLGGVGFGNDTTLSNAIRYAYNKNVTIISAAGNDVAATGSNLDQSPVFPICNDNGENMVIGVAAIDVNDQKAVFSNYGKLCVDVTAPGKRILSTINHDPVTKAKSSSAYAYASGTSLAVPFVSAQAALIKSLYPNATNVEIRNRILKTTESIDSLNLINCNSQSCAGLLGTGKINALKSLDPNTAFVTVVNEGDLVRETSTGNLYYISGGKKLPVSAFILNQKFSAVIPREVDEVVLANFPLGPFVAPAENTVIKSANDPTIYQVVDGIKRPMTFQIFQQRRITQIAVLSDVELASLVQGKLMPPLEGTQVKTKSGKTLYWVIDGQLHPMNYAFWIDRGLNGGAIMIITDSDLQSYPIGNAFIR